jgi:hypothetical protein
VFQAVQCNKGAQRLMNRFAIVALCPLLWVGAISHADDTQYRSELYVKTLDTKYVDVTVWGQIGISDSTPNPSRYQVGPKVALDACEYLSFGVNYSYFRKESPIPQTDDFEPRDEHRAEFEVNPHYTFHNGVQINLRNRWEHRWFIDTDRQNDRSRHRLEFVVPVKRMGPLTEIFSQAEVFYDYDRELTSEERIVPLGLTFKLARQVKLKTFYMWQPIQFAPGEWSSSHVFYTQLYLSL